MARTISSTTTRSRSRNTCRAERSPCRCDGCALIPVLVVRKQASPLLMKTPLTDLLQTEHPVLLAPMGNVSGGALAAAVSAAGGLGLVGGGYGDPEWLERELRAAGDARVGVGFITWSLAKRPELLD